MYLASQERWDRWREYSAGSYADALSEAEQLKELEEAVRDGYCGDSLLCWAVQRRWPNFWDRRPRYCLAST